MKSTGIVRKTDELGRVVIPIELRNKLGIEEKTPIEIFTRGNEIILKKYNPFYCKNCGLAIEENDKFCKHCGIKIN